ncbi:GPI mannosyltransferase 3 [Physcia stellaris]|nr:GPI mannosyltransferase 3 [Physcia stellaris]
MSSTPTSDASTKIGSDSSASTEEEKTLSRRAFERTQRAATSQDILLFLVAFRILNALSIRTFFQPDEYFQSLEPAWEIAFGKDSGAWITWEWKHQLRSAIHPTIFAAVYWFASRISQVLRVSPTWHADLIIAAPKATQAVFAALGDYYTWKLGEKIYGHGSNEAWAALVLTVCSPWQWFCSTRTLSNCLETTLTIVALSNWPWHWTLDKEDEEHEDGYGLRQDQDTEGQDYELAKLLVLSVSSIVDRLYYQQWTFPPFRFLYFNVAQSLSVFYGSNPWHYYLTQGLPLLLTTFLPFGIVGLYETFSSTSSWATSNRLPLLSTKILHQLATTSLIVPATLSLISHKEVRFIYPLLPVLHILASRPFTAFFLPTILPSPPSTSFTYTPRRLALLFLALSTLALSIFTTTLHQAGPLSVLTYLRNEYTTHYLTQPPTTSALQPAPSVMTPSRLPRHQSLGSGLRTPVNMNATARAAYVDEADAFYHDPVGWIKAELGSPPKQRRSFLGFGKSREVLGGGADALVSTPGEAEPWDGGLGRKSWTEYVVFFAQLEPAMRRVLKGSGYRECWRGWNSFGHDDWRRVGDVVVWCARGGKKGEERGQEKLRRGWW